MKKVFLFTIIILLTGCTFNNKDLINKIYTNNIYSDNIYTENNYTENIYTDSNYTSVALYLNNNKVTKINKKFYNDTDIIYLQTFFSNKKSINTNIKDSYDKFYKKNGKDIIYKIGYYIKFYVGDTLYENTILSYKDMRKVQPYLVTFLYDDYHNYNKGFYSHVDKNTVKNNTIYTGIKIYGSNKGSKITSPIELTVFTYDTEDDFKDGYYRGNSKYTIKIYNK